MKTVTSPIFQYFCLGIGVLGLGSAAYFGLWKSDPNVHHGHRHEEGGESHSKRSHASGGGPSNESAAGHFRVPKVERYPEHEAIFASSLNGDEALGQHVLQLLEQDKEKALEILSTLTAELNYQVVGDTLLSFFEKNGGLEKGLEAFHILDPNADITAPLLKRFLTPVWKESPEVAMKFINDFPELNGIEVAAMSIGSEVGRSDDPTKDFQTVLQGDLPDEVRSSYLASLSGEWVKKDFDGAFEYFSKLENTPILADAIYEIIGTSSAIDPQSSMEWALSIKDEGLRESAIQDVEQIWAEQDEAGYQEWKLAQSQPAITENFQEE